MKQAALERRWEREYKRKEAEQKMMNNFIMSYIGKEMKPDSKKRIAIETLN